MTASWASASFYSTASYNVLQVAPSSPYTLPRRWNVEQGGTHCRVQNSVAAAFAGRLVLLLPHRGHALSWKAQGICRWRDQPPERLSRFRRDRRCGRRCRGCGVQASWMCSRRPRFSWAVACGPPLNIFVAGLVLSHLHKPIVAISWHRRPRDQVYFVARPAGIDNIAVAYRISLPRHSE